METKSMTSKVDSTITEMSNEQLSITRESLAERIAGRLREWILVEKLEPGSVITEGTLADRLGVSRTPMREALRLLAKDGLIEIQPNRRPRVANPSLEQVCDLLDVQAAQEALAGRLCVARATSDEIDRIAEMNRHLNEISLSSDPLDFFRLDMAFHRAIVEVGRNAALLETHRQYNAALFRARFLSSRQMIWRDVTIGQHNDIVKALVARDADDAARALNAHLERAKKNIAEIFTKLARPLAQSS
jgi:DNA-binding GntR family transcriptional regulator